MTKVLLSLMFIGSLYANTHYETNKTCKGCHPTIYNEFYGSAHKRASIFEDDVHKAIWDKHPNKIKQKYDCNECHTPTDTRIKEALKNNQPAVPSKDIAQTQEAIGCIYCHSIQNIQKHPKTWNKNILVDNDKKRPTLFAANKNNRNGKILFKEESSFFGMIKKTSGSPYHDIDYTNKNFYNGNMCMGCHAHFENSHGQNVCLVEQSGAKDEEKNCITCHMPKVNGTATTIKITNKHTFHGFAGTRNKPKMMSKYLKIDFQKSSNGFNITITNLATHNLLMHPLRLGKLNVSVNNKLVKSIPFFRILGLNGKPTFPWLATEVFKDTMLKANESRTIKFDKNLNTGDKVDIVFGYFLVNPKLHKKLNLLDSKEATKFNVLKHKSIIVK
jgi:ribosomal protein L37AE/L43A